MAFIFAAKALQEPREEEVQEPREEEVRQQDPSSAVPFWKPQQEQEAR